MLVLPVVLPIIAGIVVGNVRCFKDRKRCHVFSCVTLGVSLCLMLACVIMPERTQLFWNLAPSIPVLFKTDAIAKLYMTLVAVMWTLTGIYSFEYMHHEEDESRFYCFYLITLGVLSGLSMSANIVTLYMFYEAMTLMTLPLVLHDLTKHAVAAGVKYLVYSVFGASAGLLGIFFLNKNCSTLEFVAGGSLVSCNPTILAIVFVMILGFSTKAGMFPLHGWLPTAHPVAPAPASAVLSGVITKMGVLGVIRVVFYMFGAANLRGTWVQTAWMTLALVTVFMGSMMALKEKTFKKRLAYSSVSQVSYILFGLSTLSQSGFAGSLLHIIFHSAIKITLFMTAGAIIFKTGLTSVDDFAAMGKKMPKAMICYTVVSLGLIGIPPTGGFISKWYLATGALSTGRSLSWIGPAVLLVSAILTAAYLLTITIKAFFPGEGFDLSSVEKAEPSAKMLVPMALLSVFVLAGGMFPSVFVDAFSSIASVLV